MKAQQQSHQQKIGIACPHCGSASRTRSSRAISPTYRQAIVACSDPECGFTFGVGIEITHAISPSAKPNPAIVLRQSPLRVRRADNDTFPAANDGPLSGSEVPPIPANDIDGLSATAAGT